MSFGWFGSIVAGIAWALLVLAFGWTRRRERRLAVESEGEFEALRADLRWGEVGLGSRAAAAPDLAYPRADALTRVPRAVLRDDLRAMLPTDDPTTTAEVAS